ncbi:Ser-Thr-rich glycosyl-phosphatidyl-inositol-anchored membrane family-domain-containing protein [Trichophaea hybrida]|nr:Ser-Thr-rich glycosyl-phosphatidyl-inositol-anchored membrane family-domain-containing protein [Trichophaea hybrida]
MRFATIFTATATLLLAAFTSASPAEDTTALANPISAPISGTVIKSGVAFTIEWLPTAGKTVTLLLHKGTDIKNLDTLEVIAKDLPNSGVFIWVPSKELAGDTDYAIQITSSNPNTSNYSAQFKIDSNGPGIKGTTVVPSTTRSVATPSFSGSVPTYTGTSEPSTSSAVETKAPNSGAEGVMVGVESVLVAFVGVLAGAMLL